MTTLKTWFVFFSFQQRKGKNPLALSLSNTRTIYGGLDFAAEALERVRERNVWFKSFALEKGAPR